MDPRRPELAIWRMEQLMEQFKFILDKLNTETISSKLGEAEREGSLVVQEICLVAPRLHEAMMQVSRNRRHDLSHGVIIDMSKYEVPEGAHGDEVGVVENSVEEDVNEKPKKKRKYTRKKKEEK